MVDWGFVFVDDFYWLLRKSLAEPLTCAILLFLVAFGCPLSWKKTAIGLSNTWLGVYHDVHHPKCCNTAQVAMKFAKKMTGQPTHGPKVTPAQ